MTEVVLDTLRPSTVYAAISDPAVGGVYKSPDGGQTWRATGLIGVGVNDLAIDPAYPRLVYAATDGGLYKTPDGGQTWSLLNAAISYKVAVVPTSPPTIYGCDSGYTVLKSIDGGQRFSRIFTTQNGCAALSVDPKDSDAVYVGESGYYGVIDVTHDGGRTWTVFYPDSYDVQSFAIDPRHHDTAYAAVDEGVYKTVDQGLTWRPVSFGNVPLTEAVAIDPVSSSTVVAVGYGAFISRDRGATWRHLPRHGLPDSNLRSVAVDGMGAIIHVGTFTAGVFERSLST